MEDDFDPEEKSQELVERVPRPPKPCPDHNVQVFPFDPASYAKHRAELRREAMMGRLALITIILLLLVANLYLTHRSTANLVENINWARQGQGTMEDDVRAQLREMDLRLKALEEQNRQILERLPAPPAGNAGPPAQKP